ncbi:hypothetical protein O6H91_07G042800 [Diphasiastrum complanatum]|uniref:Uncharacterized protein n=1 Tax=Diphasiastrum complanatum TaxID=34168 RepID=A0ACC2D4L3_DIPCM|nr:hypothetical protein O6H91_07G042800 [Diphasiastrum complanatum]
MDGTGGVRKSNKGKNRVPLRALARVASVAVGVQFGWAIQLSLLTPYVQELGIPHTFASYIWLCGPISGMIVQPVVGHYSDNWPGSWGRRRPFIVVGAILVVLAVLLIGFSSDLGYLLGDSPTSRIRAITVFVLGFWILDLANNTLQGPCRALLADYTGKDQRRTRRGNAFFSLFMAVGNVLGFAAGSFYNWPMVFPFTKTAGCNLACANLKSAFLVDIVILALTTLLSVTAAQEIPWSPDKKKSQYHSIAPSTPLLRDTRDAVQENDTQGEPRKVTYSVPYALTASFTSSSGGGQGLSMGVLNLAIVLPQIVVSVGSGPWDALFGGGNMPSFLFAAAAAFIGGLLALFLLPKTQRQREFSSTGIVRTHSCPIP